MIFMPSMSDNVAGRGVGGQGWGRAEISRYSPPSIFNSAEVSAGGRVVTESGELVGLTCQSVTKWAEKRVMDGHGAVSRPQGSGDSSGILSLSPGNCHRR